MADRTWVTSLMGGTPRRGGPSGGHFVGPARRTEWAGCSLLLPGRPPMSIPAAWPQVLGPLAPRAIARTTRQRPQVASRPPARPGHRAHAGPRPGRPRDPGLVEHPFPEMARAPVYGVLALRRRDGPAFRD